MVDRNNFVLIKVWTVRSCISQVMWDYVFHANRFRVELNNLLLEFSETNLIRREKLRSLHSLVAMLVQCFPFCSIHRWIFLFNVNTLTDRTFYSKFTHFGIETRKEGKLVPRQFKKGAQTTRKERTKLTEQCFLKIGRLCLRCFLSAFGPISSSHVRGAGTLASHPSGPGSITTLDVKWGLSQLDLCSASKGFSQGTAVSLLLKKPTFDLI